MVRHKIIAGEQKPGAMTIHVPSLFRFLKKRFNEEHGLPQQNRTVDIVSQCFELKPEVALALLSGEVDCIEEDDAIVFQWPEEDIKHDGGER